MCAYFESYYTAFDNEDLMELFDFEARHWQEFDPDKEGEYSLDNSALHQKYCGMFEQKIEGFIKQNGYDVHSFYTLLREELDIRSQKKRVSEEKGEEDNAEKLLALIEKSTDFAKWAESMREAALQQRQMEDVD
jgi:hypothetical protein